MTDSYFVVPADGTIRQMTKAELLKIVQGVAVVESKIDCTPQSFLPDIPDLDPLNWPVGSALIIKGKIVVPESREAVSYDIE